jgi:hypothetical protein
LTRFATRLTDFENYETVEAYEGATVQKTFVFNIISCYLPIYLTAFIYVPFGSRMAPYLDKFWLLTQFLGEDSTASLRKATFHIDRERLKKEVMYFGLTGQIVNLMFELVIPYVRQEVSRRLKTVREHAVNGVNGRHETNPAEVAQFLRRVRNEADLDTYDVNDDLREMCMQVNHSLSASGEAIS